MMVLDTLVGRLGHTTATVDFIVAGPPAHRI
jgi:hypothetical protein